MAQYYQLQIGNWSRCLTEMFGMNSDDDHVESEGSDSSKAFVLLNELSDLLMLPKDMLMESSIREEVMFFGLSLITFTSCHFDLLFFFLQTDMSINHSFTYQENTMQLHS